MDRNEQERLASEHGTGISLAEERKRSERIKRLTFELDRDEADPGIGRDRDTVSRELNDALWLNKTGGIPPAGWQEMILPTKGQNMATAMSEYDAMPDDVLHDMGMYRCNCGSAFYPAGDGTRHCEQDV